MKIIDNLKAIWNLPNEIEKIKNDRNEEDSLSILRSDIDDIRIRLNDDYYTTEEVEDAIRDQLSDYDPKLDYSDIADYVNDELDYSDIAENVKDYLEPFVSEDDFNALCDRVYELEKNDEPNINIDDCEKRVNDIRAGIDKTAEFAEKFIELYREYREKYA